MPRFYAIFLPIIAVLISTLAIILNNEKKSEKVSKKGKFLLLGFGISMLLLGLGLFMLL